MVRDGITLLSSVDISVSQLPVVPLAQVYVETQIIDALAIRDTAAHLSTPQDASRFKYGTIFITNGLNVNISVQVLAGRDSGITHLLDVGDPVTVNAGLDGGVATTAENSGFFPYITIEITAASTPTSGTVDAWFIGGQ